MTKRAPSFSTTNKDGKKRAASKTRGSAPTPGSGSSAPNGSASFSDAKPPKRSSPATGNNQNLTRLPPSAPASSLLPSIAGVPNPAQLLTQYSLLLQQSGSLQGNHAGVLANPFGTAPSTSAAAQPPAHPLPDASTLGSGGGGLGGGGASTNQLLNSIAQMVAAQASAQAAAAAALQPPAPAVSVSAASPTPPPPPASKQHLPSSSTSPPNSFILPNNMQNWSTAQLTKHVSLLNQLNQPVPHSLSLLLSEAQRRHDKKEAKRVANRKSASVSRARKKALVQEMTELNAKLKRQALILALLPDLVIAVDVEGVITFCSDQAERVLRYKSDVLVGSKLTDLLVPSSRGKLDKLIKELVGSDSKLEPSADEPEVINHKKRRHKSLKDVSDDSDPQGPPDGHKLSGVTSAKATNVAVLSDTCFPMSVVNVDVDPTSAPKKQSDDNENNSDTSASRDSKQPSSLTNSVTIPRSPIADSSGNSGSDGDDKNVKGKKTAKKEVPSSDTSNTSTSMDQANANLERNVRWHNKKLKCKQSDDEGVYKDDVIGAAVTANNASARLSSLRVHDERPEASSSEEDDSGYRESNESREETSSSAASDLTDSNGRRKPLAPTCNVCLIRNDLTTLWCEVTSSIRTREPEEDLEDVTVDTRKPPPDASRASSVTNETEIDVLPVKTVDKDVVREILLCLRPIRDGDEKVDPKFRFVARERREVSEDSNTGHSSSASGDVDPASSSDQGRHSGPAKKRKMMATVPVENAFTRARTDSEMGMDTAVAESLMLMSNRKNT